MWMKLREMLLLFPVLALEMLLPYPVLPVLAQVKLPRMLLTLLVLVLAIAAMEVVP